jgi:DNA processing protein
MVVDTHPSTHPPLPPTTEDDRLSWLRLLRSSRVGIATFYRMMAQHGSAHAALAALPDMARAAGINTYSPCPISLAEQELAKGRALGAQLLCLGDAGYPAQLLDLADPPPCLWILGNRAALARPLIAIVGSRMASSLGLRMARALAADLAAEGYVIVSGLARGVDAAAHHASQSSGTIAVMAGGADVIYPIENSELSETLLQNGLRLSEQPLGLSPTARHFPLRNRLISGLARAVIVVEAAAKSGSLITARNALDQGREVLAVPGHPFDARASGCNMLLRDGATLVRSAHDVIEAIGTAGENPRAVLPQPRPTRPIPSATPPSPPRSKQEIQDLHRAILDRLGPSPLAEDQLLRDIASPAQRVMPVLTDLELQGRIERQPGGFIALLS